MAAPVFAAEVTQERLENADKETGNWLMVHRTYDAHRFSPLDEINKDNVAKLKIAFTTQFDQATAGGRYASARNEGTPLVEDGFMYVQAGWSRIYKVDVRDGRFGKIVWKVDPEVDRQWISDATCCGAENRGIAFWKNDVIALTLDGRVMSINKDTGEVNWETQQADKARAESFTVAPLVIGDVAIYGPAGGEYGIRGWLEGIDLNTGKSKWRTHLIPGPGEPGFETWVREDTWKTGGASIWQTGSYDPESGLTFWGTGNPAPQIDAEYRPGDNLYASSLVALNPETGEMKWHFQFTPNDPYDYDEIGETQLIKTDDGTVAWRAARNGFSYAFNSGNGSLIHATQYVDDVNWTTGIDQKTGLPLNYDPEADLQKYAEGTVGVRDKVPGIYCPTLGGGKNWQPASYSSTSKLAYVTSNEGCSAYLPTAAPNPTITGGDYNVATAQQEWNGRLPAPEGTVLPKPGTGSVVAINPLTGEVKSKVHLPARGNGMLATAGGLVFMSDRAGWMYAYDDETLELLWSFNVGTSLGSPPMSYAVDGKQYIAVLAGAAPSTAQIEQEPALKYFTPSDSLFVFSID
ncbi:PQQ-binding-like beta-propeller repeat protein [Devosia sp.]|uniref:pyrroloquinoline quinone-dependent dehydrogenase n=1 Tax=Devosia sp. TaxID=1871048 RepID=UPI00260E4507|nr:PQQ-binding-like beta-propeller repeat protein [Devosia sp.]